MKRHVLLAIAISIGALGCRPAEFTLKGSTAISPISEGAVESYFPDGPTLGYRLEDTWDYGGMVLNDHEVSPNEGMYFEFLKELSPPRAERLGFGYRVELLGKGGQVLQAFYTYIETSSVGGSTIHAQIKGNPEASGYRLVTLDEAPIKSRSFPRFQESASIELRRLKDSRYILISPGRFMSLDVFVTQDQGRHWAKARISPNHPFRRDDIRGVIKSGPVLLDIRTAWPGHYFGTRFQVP